jgi:hypothetical protein
VALVTGIRSIPLTSKHSIELSKESQRLKMTKAEIKLRQNLKALLTECFTTPIPELIGAPNTAITMELVIDQKVEEFIQNNFGVIYSETHISKQLHSDELALESMKRSLGAKMVTEVFLKNDLVEFQVYEYDEFGNRPLAARAFLVRHKPRPY